MEGPERDLWPTATTINYPRLPISGYDAMVGDRPMIVSRSRMKHGWFLYFLFLVPTFVFPLHGAYDNPLTKEEIHEIEIQTCLKLSGPKPGKVKSIDSTYNIINEKTKIDRCYM
jgi:hypothetical protein